MPSKLNACLLSAVMLAALLLQCAPGAPLEDAPTDSPADDLSGEEVERPSDLLNDSNIWDSIIGATGRHKEEFKDEFQNVVTYGFLERYNISFPLPASCPHTNFSKEACLHRLAHGLPIYTALLKYVEKECPSSRIPSEARSYAGLLISWIKEKMRDPEQVTALTSSEEDERLKNLDNPTTFLRKMTAYSILRHFYIFLLDSKRALIKREMARGAWHLSLSMTKN